MRLNLTLMLALLAPVATAQRRIELSLQRAVEIALAPEGSPRVALAAQSLEQAETRVELARQALFPAVDASVQQRNLTTNLRAFGFNFEFPIPGFSLPSVVGPFGVFDARASVQQPVLDLGILRRLRAARAGLEAARHETESTRNQVSDRVARAYLGCLRGAAAVETARANVELGEALVKLAESQRAAGTGTGIEVTRAQVQLANGRQRLIAAENDRRRAVLELLRGMGLDLTTDVTFADRLVYRPVNVTAAEAELEKARAERAEIRGQKRREETARLNYDAVRAESLPSVAAFGDYGAIGSALANIRGTHTVGVSLRIPLFDGRRNARREDSRMQYRAEQIRTRDLEQQVELEVRLALDSLRSAQAQVETAREGLALAENELEQARRRYQAGVTSSIEVTDAQTRLDRARENHIAALYGHSLARIDLATATGAIAEYVNP
jgi:outer membrane protein TolC